MLIILSVNMLIILSVNNTHRRELLKVNNSLDFVDLSVSQKIIFHSTMTMVCHQVGLKDRLNDYRPSEGYEYLEQSVIT